MVIVGVLVEQNEKRDEEDEEEEEQKQQKIIASHVCVVWLGSVRFGCDGTPFYCTIGSNKMSLYYINIINLLCTVDRQRYTRHSTQIDDSINRHAHTHTHSTSCVAGLHRSFQFRNIFAVFFAVGYIVLVDEGEMTAAAMAMANNNQNDIDPAVYPVPCTHTPFIHWG